MWIKYVHLIGIQLVIFPSRAKVYEWGLWGTWSTCSESCGKGIETRQRRCFKTSSASRGIKTSAHRRSCTGNSLEFQFCYVKDCAGNDEKFVPPKVTYHDAYEIRAQQCTEFDKKSYNGKNIKWKPYLRNHLDACKLYCLADGQKFYARLKDSVRDGTPCGRDYSNVCIKGKCQKRPQGCQKLNGPCVLDERKKILGVFNSTKLNLGYNLVATIPAGATNITIEELTRSRSYLALKNHNSGTYHLNGHWMISLSKTFRLASSQVTYTRNGNTRHGGEMITIDGPLKKSLDVMMIYQRDPSIVMYSYFVTKDKYKRIKHQSRSEGQHLFFLKYRGNSQQTDQKNSPPTRQTLLDKQTPQNTDEGESISLIAGRQQPSYTGQRTAPYTNTGGEQGITYPQRSTGQNGKKASWYGSSWVQFGGDQNPKTKQTSGPGIQVARRPFLNQQVFKPNQFGKAKLPQYKRVPQTVKQFDDSQGTGYQRARWGSTVNRFGGAVLPKNQDRLWQNGKKQFYTSNQGNGPAYRWKRVGFTPCSSTCAGGTQSGIVKCTSTSSGEHVADIKCDPKTRIQETRACNLEECPASWVPQEWKTCSKTCGEGEQVRDLMCKKVIDSNGEKVPVMLPVVKCPVRLRPEVMRKCFLRECPKLAKPKWILEKWSECSVECGHGVQRRNVICKNYQNKTVDDSECFRVKKPVVLKACYLGLCKADWYVRSEWSQCSQTCGSGIRTRAVVCARIEGSQLLDKHCKGKTKPDHEEKCNTKHCKGIWVTSEWSKCSTDCGKGVQQRVVICMNTINGNYHETFDADCSLDDKPAVRKDCSSFCVPSWFTTPWTQCSVTCGHGVESRHVSCLSGEGKRVGGCKAWERPQQKRACYPKACPGTKPTRKPILCKDNPPRSFKRYCHIIKRINYCRILSYKQRCCATCTPKAQILGHI